MKYALVIGNSKYNDPKLAQLKTPEADSRALAKVLRAKRIGNFDEVASLIDQTEAKTRRAISTFLSNKKPDDLVLIYFSGHGVLDGRGSLFLALKDTQINALNATAISSSFISYEMDNCRSRRQILILDCCNSGAFARGTKGPQKAVTESTFEGSGSGRVVLTASDSTQFAFEGDRVIAQTDFSLFTHFLLEGLKTGKADRDNDGKVSLDEWYDYCHARITATTPQQVPHKWSYHQQGDLIIAQNPFVKKKPQPKILQLRAMLDQKQKDFQQHKLLLDSKELAIIAAGLENTKLELQEGDKQLILLSSVIYDDGQRWLAIFGNNGLDWLRQAYQSGNSPQELRLGAVRCLGEVEDEQTYKQLLGVIQPDSQPAERGNWLDLMAHYLNRSRQYHHLSWSVRCAVFPRLAHLRVNAGSAARARARKIASLITPICVIIMMVPVFIEASKVPETQPLDYFFITLILGLLGVFVGYLFAEIITSLMLITGRWSLPLQAILLAGMGSAIGIILSYILSGQTGLWFEGGITSLAQMILNRGIGQKPRWFPAVTALFAGLVVFLASLQVIQDARLVEYGAALSTGLFTAIYTYMTRSTE
jgi:Caspase domain